MSEPPYDAVVWYATPTGSITHYRSFEKDPFGSIAYKLEAEALHRKYRTLTHDVLLAPDFCVFCFRHKDHADKCSYDLRHEFIEGEKLAQPTKKVDANLCLTCGTHKRNPLSKSNGCSHSYPLEGG